jgi:hypothetical protein
MREESPPQTGSRRERDRTVVMGQPGTLCHFPTQAPSTGGKRWSGSWAALPQNLNLPKCNASLELLRIMQERFAEAIRKKHINGRLPLHNTCEKYIAPMTAFQYALNLLKRKTEKVESHFTMHVATGTMLLSTHSITLWTSILNRLA